MRVDWQAVPPKKYKSYQHLYCPRREPPRGWLETIRVVKNPLDTDNWIYRIIVLSLGITIISIIIGVIVLIGSGKISDDKGVPTILTAIGSAAIGALAGLLAPQPKSN